VTTSEPVVVTPAVLREWPLPDAGSGKQSRGELLVVGGTATTPGAVLLAAEAALRAGAGKLAVAVVEVVARRLGVALPEAMVAGMPGDDDGHLSLDVPHALVEQVERADVALLGPGFTDPSRSSRLLASVVPSVSTSLVVDALGSAYVGSHPDGLHHLDGRAVLTVNPTELGHVAGVDPDDLDPATHSLEVASRSGVVVLCGGTSKHVAAPDGRLWVVQGGGPGLGVSGSGDVQAGIVAGLLARGAEPAQAALWGAHLHARAGERLAASVGTVGYLARELPAEVPRVLTELG
jgi:ADP-dependent NAD(P)H-hydrate dehydratase